MLDIKSKSNNIFINTFLLIAIFVTISASLLAGFPNIEENKRARISEELSKSDVSDLILESSYGLYYDMLKTYNEKDPIDTMLDFNIDYVDKSYLKENVNGIISNYNTVLKESKIIEYYAINEKGDSLSRYNKNRNIQAFLSDDKDILKNISKEYLFYMVLSYDENGDLEIINSSNRKEHTNTTFIKNRSKYIEANSSSEKIELNKIKNMTYIFAIPANITEVNYGKYDSYVNNYIVTTSVNEMNNFSIKDLGPYSVISLLIVFLLALVIPYKVESNIFGVKSILKIPLEFLSFILLIAFSMIPIIIMHLLQTYNIYDEQRLLSSLLLISILTLLFILIFISVLLVKYIFKTGLWSYLKKHSIIIRILIYIIKKSASLYKMITTFDIKKGVNKKLLILIGINFIIISLISMFWFFGIVLSLVYSITLFILIKKKTNKITSDYNNLFEETKKIANGNLGAITDENLGLFNDIKNELSDIGVGFRSAVNKEVKSQRMKTELISNVSHDLKTPLTSIISYVDLLKGENLSEEKRLDYLDILDRKSQRLQVLIEDLFEVSKATSGNITLNIIDVDVVSVMKETLVELEDRIKEANLDIRTRFSNGKIVLPLDSQRIYRVFENLVVNITKYAMKGSRAYIDIFEVEDKVIIELKNMSQEEITFSVDEIVERFIRGDKSRNTEGSGVGLALAKTFVDLQGGTFEVMLDGDLFKVIITFKNFFKGKLINT
ncbi:HAMP domain-containing histidine kinase [Clostridium gasigenes]|uniref:sensor histidine kinase n=1 Tax=Clostridium gasigenes TaxID=94869 RepID=UPI001C0C390E|nr:HAMP domain-containing histidine kinase [Clostridium gasigenes]